MLRHKISPKKNKMTVNNATWLNELSWVILLDRFRNTFLLLFPTLSAALYRSAIAVWLKYVCDSKVYSLL